MSFSPRFLALASIALLMGLGGCDALTGPDRGGMRIILSQAGGAGSSFAVVDDATVAADGRHDDDRDKRDHDDPGDGHRDGGGIVLALVDDFEVTITAVQALPARFVDRPFKDDDWEILTLDSPVTVNLLALPFDEDGLAIISGDLEPGAYVRLRFLISEASLDLQAPLTVGGKTFPADEDLFVKVPNPWVNIPGAFFTVADDGTGEVHIVFDPSVSLGQIRVQNGILTLTPVFRPRSFESHHRHD